MDILSTLFYFIVVIFVLVSVHEFGHFITARIFGMHVPVFSVGMGRRLFGFNKLNGFTFGPLSEEMENRLGANTDYRLSVLPLGGYAKIAGMIDETQTKEMVGEPQPWEFRAKPWWQKTIVISGGVVMNMITAGLIFAGAHYLGGNVIVNTTEVGYVSSKSVAREAGIQPGDRILAVNGNAVKNWNDVQDRWVENAGRDLRVEFDRSGARQTAVLPAKRLGIDEKYVSKIGLTPVGYSAATIEGVIASQPAERAGVKEKDIITSVGGVAVPNMLAVMDELQSHPNEEIELGLIRAGQPLTLKVTPTAEGKIGIELGGSDYKGPMIHEEFGFFESIGMGFTELNYRTKMLVSNMAMLFTGQVEVRKALGGPIKIAQYAGKSGERGSGAFFDFMAMLSISLAFLNILPVPALDGGHLIIILLEAIMGRELSQGFKLGLQKVGVVLLLGLMAFMVFNDISGL